MNPLPRNIDKSAEIAERMLETIPAREVIPPHPSHSFRWLDHDYPSQIAKWQYHPEIEIHLIRKSHGSYIIGDRIGAFEPGQVAIVGAEIPHDWMSDIQPGEVFENRDAVIQFLPEWLESCMEVIPEVSELRKLLVESKRGIIYVGQTRIAAAEAIEKVGRASGIMRIQALFELLGIMANAPAKDKEFQILEWLAIPVGEDATRAVEAGLAYIFSNLTQVIKMSEAAKLAHMSEPTFSKYFKKASGFTFSDTVRKLRIAHACRMLDQTDKSISAVCSASGYTNLANFNRQFLFEVNLTPSAYRNMAPDARPKSNPLSLGLRSSELTR
jgi:AraC-like DNA-binding protein